LIDAKLRAPSEVELKKREEEEKEGKEGKEDRRRARHHPLRTPELGRRSVQAAFFW